MKVILFFLLILSQGFLSTSKSFADKVFLKKGGFIEGEIISQDDKNLSIKTSDGGISKIQVSFIKSFLKKEDIDNLSPFAQYKSRKNAIKKSDAKGHYELGLFCINNGMYNYADYEFNEALKLDKNYEAEIKEEMRNVGSKYSEILYKVANYYYMNNEPKLAKSYFEKIVTINIDSGYVAKSNNSLAKINKEISEKKNKEKINADLIESLLEKDIIYLPETKFEETIIIGYSQSFSEEKKIKFAEGYLLKAEELMLGGKVNVNKTLLCYDVALDLSYGNDKLTYKIGKSKGEFVKKFMPELGFIAKPNYDYKPYLEIPNSEKKIKDIVSFIYCLNEPAYGFLYLDLGNQYVKKNTKKDLQIAINCYNIALMFSENPNTTAQILSIIKETKSKIK